jgi:hypothetical protein
MTAESKSVSERQPMQLAPNQFLDVLTRSLCFYRMESNDFENWESFWKERKAIVLNVFIYFISKIFLKTKSLITNQTENSGISKASVCVPAIVYVHWIMRWVVYFCFFRWD